MKIFIPSTRDQTDLTGYIKDIPYDMSYLEKSKDGFIRALLKHEVEKITILVKEILIDNEPRFVISHCTNYERFLKTV